MADRFFRLLLLTIFITVLAFAAFAAAEGETPTDLPGGDDDGFGASSGAAGQDVFTAGDVPASFLQPCKKYGRVERVRYILENDESKQVKRAMVYLPVGYDDSDQPYNILYVLHGSGGSVNSYLREDSLTEFQNLIDNLIYSGMMEPMIVVAATYEPSDLKINWMPLAMQVTYTEAFQKELTEVVIPAVEGKYRTYAETTDAAGLLASRRHRGIGGFSLGGTAVWYTFLRNMDSFAWFIPISEASWDDGEGGTAGIWDSNLSARVIYDAVMEQGYGRDDFHLFVATGTDDSAFEITTDQMKSLLEYSDIFVTGRNTNCAMMIDGMHEFTAVFTYMYHILPKLFVD